MALIQNHFFSGALTECNSLTVIIPAESCPKQKYPVVWLLPPAGKDHTAWLRYSNIEQIAETYGVMVVMPDMKLSYGLDMVHGFSYFTMLKEELPEMIADYFPADMAKQMIAGVQEGAYAAMLSALRAPDRFLAAAAFSGGSMTDTDGDTMTDYERKQVANAFGTGDLGQLAAGPYDLQFWIKQLPEKCCEFYLAYSDRDRYGDSARMLADHLHQYRKENLTVAVLEQAMGWGEWAESLKRMIKRVF